MAVLQPIPCNIAEQALQSLAKGQPPLNPCAIELLSVGHEHFLQIFRKEYLQGFLSRGRSFIRFFHGQYGEGKSHLLSLLRACALQSGCAVSLLEVTATTDSLSDQLGLYREALARLEVPWGVGRGLEGLIASAADGQLSDMSEYTRITQEIEVLGYERKAPRNVSRSLVTLLKAEVIPGSIDDELTSALRGYLKGTPRPKASMRGKLLKDYSAIASLRLTKRNAARFLSGVATCLTALGTRGWLVLLDEVDPPATRRSTLLLQRQLATLRHITDAAAISSLPFVGLCYAVPPDHLEHWRDCYDPLAQRILRPEDTRHSVNPRAPTCELSELSEYSGLECREKQFREIARRIAHIGTCAGYNGYSGNGHLEGIVIRASQSYARQAMRELVREVTQAVVRGQHGHS